MPMTGFCSPSRRPFVAVIPAVLLLAGAAISFWPAPADAQGPSDWAITSLETIADGVRELKGNITIESGGELRLTNATVVINCSKDAEFRLEVRQGGRLQADRANITAGPSGSHYTFRVNGSLDLRSTEVSGTRGHFYDGGSELGPSSTATISGCHLFGNQYYAVVVNGTSPSITNCTIDAEKGGIRVENGGAPVITGNLIRSAAAQAIIVFDSRPVIRNNRLLGDFHGIDLSNSKPEISGNEIANCALWGIQCVNRADANLTGNAISGCAGDGISVISSSPYIAGNSITGNGVGVNTSGASAVLSGNTITGNRQWGVLARSGAPSLGDNKYTDAGGARNGAGDVAVVYLLSVRVEQADRSLAVGAEVTVKDGSGAPVFTGLTGQDGTVSGIECYQYHINASGRTGDTPHKVSVKHAGQSSSTTVTMDKDRQMTARLGQQGSSFIPGPGALGAALACVLALFYLRTRMK